MDKVFACRYLQQTPNRISESLPPSCSSSNPVNPDADNLRYSVLGARYSAVLDSDGQRGMNWLVFRDNLPPAGGQAPQPPDETTSVWACFSFPRRGSYSIVDSRICISGPITFYPLSITGPHEACCLSGASH